jgi:sterol desaturase/sphingolipid hydroxylase (fatty acid hydroxylase superfamily)
MDWAAEATADLWTASTALVVPALIFAVIALVARGIEAIRIARKATPEIRTNSFLFAFDVLVTTPLLVIALTFTGAFIQRSSVTLLTETWSALHPWLVILIAVFIGDFIGYWRHRLEHTWFLWPAHAIHHSDTAMTWTTLFRFHPLNRLTTSLIDTSALALLGLPPEALAANLLVRHYYGMFIHMDLPWTYGLLGRLLVSPAMHRWHHIRDSNGAGVNFATVFSVFDQAFRTYHVPGPCNASLGVRDEVGQGALAQLTWPFKVSYRSVAARMRSSRKSSVVSQSMRSTP